MWLSLHFMINERAGVAVYADEKCEGDVSGQYMSSGVLVTIVK